MTVLEEWRPSVCDGRAYIMPLTVKGRNRVDCISRVRGVAVRLLLVQVVLPYH